MNTAIEKPAPSMVTEPSAAANTGRSPAPAPISDDGHSIMETVLMRGDLSKLSAQERNQYYLATCKSLGLNPLTRPFDFMMLNGKLVLYAKRDAADQLRSIRGINLEIVSRRLDGELYEVHCRATDKDGRRDEDFGVVALGQTRGDIRANLILKAVTKAKRRTTLSICGLGLPDESEVEDIPAKDKLVLTEPVGGLVGPDDPVVREVAAAKAAIPDRSRDIYQGMRAEIDVLIDSGISPKDFWQWGKDNEPRVREMSSDWGNELRHYWMEKYRESQEHHEALNALKPLKHEDSPQTLAEYLEK